MRRTLASFSRRLVRNSRGQVSVIVGLSAVGLTGAIGTGMDTAALHRSGSKLQDAVDAAALHAVRAGDTRKLSDRAIEAEAKKFLAATYKPDAASADDASITASVVSHAPTKVSVEATGPVELPFGFLRGREVTVTRTATAVEANKSPVTLLLLAPNASAAWYAGGNSKVTVDDGVAVVNSTSGSALNGHGAAKIVTTSTLVAGPVQSASNWTPKPKFGASPVPDPYASQITWPAAGGCAPVNSFKKKTATISPGTYCGGLNLTTHADVTLSPGVYVLTGPLSVTSQSRLNAPSGVTIVLMGDTADVHVQAGSEMIIRAPTSGAWKDIAIAVKPQPTEITSTLIGGGELDLNGVLYMPTQKLALTGGGAAGINTGKRIVIANRLETKGNGEVYLKGDGEVLAINLGARLAS